MVSHKLYVSHHIFFRDHISFFSINVSKAELVYINPLLDDTNSFPANTSTSVPDRHAPPSPPMATLAPSKIVDPPPTHSSLRLRKSI